MEEVQEVTLNTVCTLNINFCLKKQFCSDFFFLHFVYIFPVFSVCIVIKRVKNKYGWSLKYYENNKAVGGPRLLHNTVYIKKFLLYF